jgi:hypothetical protein
MTPPLVIRLFEPISFIFPKAGATMPQLAGTVPSPACILCDGPASPPSRMGVIATPERQVLFVTCGSCSDVDDAELERRIAERVSQAAEEPILVPTREGKWAARAAQEWTTPLMGQADRRRAS